MWWGSGPRGQEDCQGPIDNRGKEIGRKAPHPAQEKMIYGLKKLRKSELDAVSASGQKLVQMMEAQHVKVTRFFNEEQ
jgi:hypothetical protein